MFLDLLETALLEWLGLRLVASRLTNVSTLVCSVAWLHLGLSIRTAGWPGKYSFVSLFFLFVLLGFHLGSTLVWCFCQFAWCLFSWKLAFENNHRNHPLNYEAWVPVLLKLGANLDAESWCQVNSARNQTEKKQECVWYLPTPVLQHNWIEPWMNVIPINLHQGFGLDTSLLHFFFDHGKLCVWLHTIRNFMPQPQTQKKIGDWEEWCHDIIMLSIIGQTLVLWLSV